MGRQPGAGDDPLMAELRELRRQIKEVATAAGLSMSSIGAGGLVVRGDGAIRSDDFEPGAAGYRLGGDTLEVNDIVLRGGIIGNDALTSPIEINGDTVVQQVFGVTTSEAAYAETSLTIPPGFSRALVVNTVTASIVNSTASSDYLYIRALVNGTTGGGAMFGLATAGGAASVAATIQRTLTGLDGGVITVGARMNTQVANWASNPSNTATVNAFAIFRR